jgi:hypothetical protein
MVTSRLRAALESPGVEFEGLGPPPNDVRDAVGAVT